MVAFGRTKYFMASQKAERNSVSNKALAVSAKRFTRRLLYVPSCQSLRMAATTTTMASDSGRKTFHPSRISWS